jgi:transcription initiation factor TFIIIB Brf1 subunit/transcription initiation factor TFIIB
VAKSSKSEEELRAALNQRQMDEAFNQYKELVNTFIRSPANSSLSSPQNSTGSPDRSDRSDRSAEASQLNSSQELSPWEVVAEELAETLEASSIPDGKASNMNDMNKQEVLLEDDDAPEVIIDTADIDFSTESGEADLCSHENILREKGLSICEDCGVELYEEISHEQEWRYFGDQDSRNPTDPSRCQWRKGLEKGIKKELEQLGFPPDICELADELYLMITNGEIKKSELRKGIVFCCVYEAYKMKGRTRTPDDLKNKFFNLNKKTISRGVTYYKMKCPREYFQYEDISAKHFIPQLMRMKQFNTSEEHIAKVVKLYEKVKDSCPVINRSNPQSISKALIYYYFRRKGCMISATCFGKIVALSDVIILRLAGEISRVLGTNNTVDLD